MKSYVELSNELNKLESERRSLKDTKGKMVEEVEAIIRAYPEFSSILPKNIMLIDSKHLEDRFSLLEEEISDLKISDEEKQSMIKVVTNTREKIKEIELKVEELDEKMIALGPDLYNRKTYVIDRVLELQKVKTERETIEAELEIQKEELLKDKYNEIMFGRKKVIFNLEQKRKELLKKEDEIRKEENLYQDARLITEEKIKEAKEVKEKEELVVVSDEEEQKVNDEVSNDNSVNIEPTQYVSEIENEVKNVENNESIENTQEEKEEKTQEEQLEENNEQVEALVPEEPKKVKKVEKANLKLKLNSLKKAGKIALGVGALAITVAFFVANPLLITQFIPQMLGEVGAAALAVSTIKERKK